jgi:hypothetical protein
MFKPKAIKISPKRDARNRELIERAGTARFNYFSRGLSPDWRWQLEQGTPEDRATYVRKLMRRFYIVMIPVMLVVCALTETGPKLTPKPPIEEPAGQILSIQLHETSFSTTSTIETSSGTYQVQGAVSAAIGNQVTLIAQKTPQVGPASICVASEIKTWCYRLL